MAIKSKFFRVAVEGETATDGRKIEKSWLTDIAATYAPSTYTALVNLEHIRGYTPKSDFKSYGKVLAVKTEEVTLSIGGKDEKRTALYAEIEPTDDLVAFTRAKQKQFTSIEVAPNFGGSGKANLVGLAVTDSPASLGTELLQFSAKADDANAAALKAVFDSRKLKPEHHLTAALETKIEFQDDAPTVSLADAITGVLKDIFTPKTQAPEPAKTDPAPAGDQAALLTAVQDAMTKGFAKVSEVMDGRFNTLEAAQTADRTAFNDFVEKLDHTPKPHTTQRHRATGGADVEMTDC